MSDIILFNTLFKTQMCQYRIFTTPSDLNIIGVLPIGFLDSSSINIIYKHKYSYRYR